MADLASFTDPGFDPKSWVNNVCAQCPASEALEKYLAEAEMRLQLAAEEIEAGLQDSSALAVRRIPFAVQEIYRLQGDIQGMRDHVKGVSSQVAQHATEASASVAVISQLDLVKGHMELACSTLKEATELSGLFIKVEEVFASGDLPRVADMLAVMRRSLTLVGDVPEFKAGWGRLKTLEDRLQGMVEGSLTQALAKPAVVHLQQQQEQLQGDGHADGGDAGASSSEEDEQYVAALAGLLLAVGRYATVEGLYLDGRLAFVHSLWEESSSSTDDLLTWLPRFYARLLPVLDAEQRWCHRVLPSQQQQLMTALLSAVLTKVSKATRDRLAAARLPAPQLPSLAAEMGSFARGVAGLVSPEMQATQRLAVLGMLYAPLEDLVSGYAALEASTLGADLQAALGPIKATPVADSKAEHLVSCLPGALRAATSASLACIERCVAFTGGSELPALYKVLDAALQAWVAQLGQYISSTLVRTSAAAKPGASPQGADASNDDDITAVLQLVVLVREVPGRAFLRGVDSAFRAALAAALPRLQSAAATAASLSTGPKAATTTSASSGGGAGPGYASKPGHMMGGVPSGPGGAGLHAADALVMRMTAGGDTLGAVQRLASSFADARCVALPQTSVQVESLCSMVDNTALTMLLSRVHAMLKPLASMPDWVKGSRTSGSGAAHPSATLPSFSAYPLAYVTTVGEYLMLLPQQLEVLMGGGEEDTAEADGGAEDELAGQWLDRVVTAAASAYLEAINAIPQLTHQGGIQLAADVEYFCNVMSALQVMPPLGLLAVQLYAGLPPAQLVDAWKAAVAEARDDTAAIRSVAALRRVKLEA